MATRYKVTLTSKERQTLGTIVSKGKHSAAKIKHANILLAVNESDGRVKQSDADIAKQFHCHYNTITRIKQRFVEQGFDTALKHKQRATPAIEPMFDGRKEAQLIQLACSPPPEGHCAWAEEVSRLLDEDFPDAEIELSVLTKMCLNRRIADMETYRKEVQVWQEERNGLGGSMNWQFTSANARTKLKKLYPLI